MTGPRKHLTMAVDEVALLLAEDWQRDIELLETSHIRTLGTIDAMVDGTVNKLTDKAK